MKFICLLFIASFLYSSSVYADEDVLRPKGKPAGYYETEEDYLFERLPFAFGFEVGGNYNMFSQNITYSTPLNNPTLGQLTNASGLSFYIGLFGDVNINKTFGLHLKLQYNQVYLMDEATGLVDGTLFDENTGQIIETRLTSSSMEWNNSFSYFNIEPSLRINITDKLFGLIGLTAQFPISNITGEFTQTALEDGFFYYDENLQPVKSRTFEVDDDALNPRYGLNLSLGYKANISKNFYLVPQIHFHYFASNFSDDELMVSDTSQEFTNGISFVDITDKSLNHLRFSVAFWFQY